jgi:hypothetical protein
VRRSRWLFEEGIGAIREDARYGRLLLHGRQHKGGQQQEHASERLAAHRVGNVILGGLGVVVMDGAVLKVVVGHTASVVQPMLDVTHESRRQLGVHVLGRVHALQGQQRDQQPKDESAEHGAIISQNHFAPER